MSKDSCLNADRIWVFANAKIQCEESVSSSTPQIADYANRAYPKSSNFGILNPLNPLIRGTLRENA
jgi:hypothetical protein